MFPKALICVDGRKMTATVCPWCEDWREADQFARSHGLAIKNDRCDDCAERFRAEIKAERASKQPFPPLE